MLAFNNDYSHGAHPAVLQALVDTNMEPQPGYGTDAHTERAKQLIREACQAPDADVFFLVGGTQANATVIDMLLAPYEGVVAAETGHVACHEAGAIEFGGHKVLTIPGYEARCMPRISRIISRCSTKTRATSTRCFRARCT